MVFRRCLAGIGRHLLEEVQHLGRGWGTGLVEEGDDVLGFTLRRVSSNHIHQHAIETPDLGSERLTKPNIFAVWVYQSYRLVGRCLRLLLVGNPELRFSNRTVDVG